MNAQAALLEAVRQGDRDGALAAIDTWRAEHPSADFFSELLAPMLTQVGDEWLAGSLSLAQAYVATKVAEEAIPRLVVSADGAEPRRGPVVLGNAEEDFHGLGRHMVRAYLRARGWEVEDLGNDASAEDLVDAAVACRARVIGVSAMMLTTARHVAEIRRVLDERRLSGRIQLAAGGAVFNVRPELVRELGADGSARSAMEAPALFERLWQQALTHDLEVVR